MVGVLVGILVGVNVGRLPAPFRGTVCWPVLIVPLPPAVTRALSTAVWTFPVTLAGSSAHWRTTCSRRMSFSLGSTPMIEAWMMVCVAVEASTKLTLSFPLLL